MEILRIKGAERRFNSGAETHYSVAHAPAQQRNPDTGADENLWHAHGRWTAGMQFVIEIGALPGRHLVEIFSRHDCKNVIFLHAGFRSAPGRAYRKKADSPPRNPMRGFLVPVPSAMWQSRRSENAKRDHDGGRRFPDRCCSPSRRTPDIDRSFCELAGRSGRVSSLSKDWAKSVQTRRDRPQ